MSQLPPAPRKLAPRFVRNRQIGAAVAILFAIVAIGVYGVWQFREVRQLLHEQEVWAMNSNDVAADVDGEVTTRRLIFRSYDLVVRYAGCGGVCEGPLEFSTLFGEIDDSGSPVVRFDPENPRDFALSYAVGSSGIRWGAIIFMFVVGAGVIGGTCLVLAWAALRNIRDARRVCDDAAEVECTIDNVRHIQGGSTEYVYSLPETYAGRGKLKHSATFSKNEGPVLTREQSHLVVLVPNSGPLRPYVPRQSGYPFEPAGAT